MTKKKTACAGRSSAPEKAALAFSGPIPSVLPAPSPESPSGMAGDWLRVPKPGMHLYGLTRSFFYQLAAAGLIRTMSLKVPGKKRGVRLIHRPSLEAYLSAQDAQQNGGSR
jgi:hypothetical protein